MHAKYRMKGSDEPESLQVAMRKKATGGVSNSGSMPLAINRQSKRRAVAGAPLHFPWRQAVS
jgi:hypothetical protein